MKYSEKFIFTEEDFDDLGNLLPEKVLSVFQHLAGQHAENLGIGFQAMLKRNLLWVVTQIKYQITGKTSVGQSLIGTTWPSPPSRLGFERQYTLSDEQGNVLIKGVSNWVVIDTKSRRFCSVDNLYPSDDYCTAKCFPDRLKRIKDFQSDGESFTVCPNESDIDNNGHVNNTKYARFIFDALDGFKGELDSFRIEYIHEVMPHQSLSIEKLEDGKTVNVKGLHDQNRMFACIIEYK